MQTVQTAGLPELARLLTEALALADTLGLAIPAIHIDEAIGQIAAIAPPPVDHCLTMA